MNHVFASSHLPEDNRPLDEEEEEDDVQPMLRAGGVRALSHLRQRLQGEPAAPRPAVPTYLPAWITEPLHAEHWTAAEADPESHGDFEPPAIAHSDGVTGLHGVRNPLTLLNSRPFDPRGGMLPEHAEQQQQSGDQGRFGGYSRSASPGTPYTDTPPEPSARGAAEGQRGDSWGDRPPPTRPDFSTSAMGRGFDGRGTAGASDPGQGLTATGPFRQQRLQGSQRDVAALKQARGANPPAQGGRLGAQPQAPAQGQRPAAGPAQNAPAAPQPPAGGVGGNQAGQHPYKIHEADENAEIVRTADASAPPPRKGAKFGEHARSVINEALDNSPTARAALNKACKLSEKNVVIHSTTATNAHPQIGLDGTIHVYVNPNTLLPGTLTHEIAHAIQKWHQQKAERANRAAGIKATEDELEATSLQGRKDLHGIAPVTYVEKGDDEPVKESVEHEAMRLANITNAEISAAKVKAKIEAFKKSNSNKFNEMSKDPEKFAQYVAQSFWFEQKNKEAISHQDNNKEGKSVPMRESTLYGKEGGLQHVLETLGYGVTLSHIKNAAPLRAGYSPPK